MNTSHVQNWIELAETTTKMQREAFESALSLSETMVKTATENTAKLTGEVFHLTRKMTLLAP